ncbi:putative 37S ribosomal protein S18 [Talaromyces proteolyticus]|uniref:Small ribosomal subunit protein bS18m n=1 Tax=Talaromyces proteolyticus TaxID=1131652 RepID=A0AAD4L183_9EURO|nr:putative 37S ribosomal protein S18 [Talaromyces proteolyticus]KAH8704730.1 putative 37S ribosomal protein S18 [Talaromyces proteolyticus]
MSLGLSFRKGVVLSYNAGTFAPSCCRWASSSASLKTVFTTPTKKQSYSSPGKMKALTSRQRITQRSKIMEESKNQAEGRTLEKFQSREWTAGDVYSPHDFGPTEMKKWMKRWGPETDAFDALNINPLDQYKNFSIMSEYVTPMGRIKARKFTGLRPVNQRKIAKAIRRAIAVGLMPSVHRHPEILALEAKSKYGSL